MNGSAANDSALTAVPVDAGPRSGDVPVDVTWWHSPAVRDAQRRTMRTLSLSQVVGSLGMGAAPTVGILLAEQVTSSEVFAGVARTSTTLGAALAGIPLAMLAARYGRRVALGAGWFTAATGAGILVLAAATNHLVPLVCGMLLIGVGSAVGLQARFAATDLAAPARRARALAMVVWVGTLGSVIGPNLGVPGEALEDATGLPAMSGAFVIAAGFLLVAGTFVLVFLRPGPVVPVGGGVPAAEERTGAAAASRAFSPEAVATALRTVWRVPASRLAFVGVISAHAVMVGVMTMTPVHLHHNGGSISVIGVTISIHVIGMFAFAPLAGMLADRAGPVVGMAVGGCILLASLAVDLLWGGSTDGVVVGLFLLGLGWSFVTVTGSSMLVDAVPPERRTLVQGVSDTSMNVVAAAAAALSGPAMAVAGFGGLAACAAVILTPMAWLLVSWAAHHGTGRKDAP